jgi:hypothetical protein
MGAFFSSAHDIRKLYRKLNFQSFSEEETKAASFLPQR